MMHGRAEVEYLQDERPDRATRDEEPVRNVVMTTQLAQCESYDVCSAILDQPAMAVYTAIAGHRSEPLQRVTTKQRIRSSDVLIARDSILPPGKTNLTVMIQNCQPFAGPTVSLVVEPDDAFNKVFPEIDTFEETLHTSRYRFLTIPVAVRGTKPIFLRAGVPYGKITTWEGVDFDSFELDHDSDRKEEQTVLVAQMTVAPGHLPSDKQDTVGKEVEPSTNQHNSKNQENPKRVTELLAEQVGHQRALEESSAGDVDLDQQSLTTRMGDPEREAGRPSWDGNHLLSYGPVSTPLSYPVRAGQPPSYTDLPIPLEEQGPPSDDIHNEDGVMKAVDAAAVGIHADNVDKWKMPITNLREYLSTPFEDGGQATRAEHLKTLGLDLSQCRDLGHKDQPLINMNDLRDLEQICIECELVWARDAKVP